MREENFKDPFSGTVGCFHFSTDALTHGVLFRDEADFVFGINTLALETLEVPIGILCYCLMDNHFHILVQGTWEQCHRYMRQVLGRMAVMHRGELGWKFPLRKDAFEIIPVTSRQQLKNEVVYILRNPYKARIEAPESYLWSSASVFFNPWISLMKGEPVGKMPVLVRRVLFRTKAAIPPDWEVVNGRILDKCFVRAKQIENLFGGSVEFFDKLRKYDIESTVELSHGIAEKITYSDTELRQRMVVICRNEFHVDSPDQLARKDLLRLSQMLARRFGVSKNQMARLVSIDQEILERIL